VNLLDAASLAFQGAALLFVLGLPIKRLITSGRFWPSFLRMWLYLFIWSLLFCFIIPLVITGAFHMDAFKHFPEGRGIPAMLMIGWLPCLILCSITWVIRTLWIWFRSRSKPN